MIADHLRGIEKIEADLWKIADNLRANSNLASNEYFMPIMTTGGRRGGLQRAAPPKKIRNVVAESDLNALIPL